MSIEGTDASSVAGSQAHRDSNGPRLSAEQALDDPTHQLERYKTEAIEARQELKRLREHYEDLLFHAPVGYLSLDLSGSIDEINAAAARVLGRNRRELMGRLLHDVLTPRSRDLLKAHLETVLKDDRVHRCELVALVADGRRDIELVSTRKQARQPGEASDGGPTIQTAIFDISGIKETAREKSLLEEQLRQAHKMEALGRLAGGIAHDFNNLLTLIIGYSKLALNNMSEDDPFHIHIAQINKAGNHAAELIDQLLSFSRNHHVSPDTLDLNELIADMSSMIARIIGDDIELRLDVCPTLGTVYIDATQLRQVLLNLVVNAREAMPSGGTLVLRTRNTELQPAAADKLGIQPGPYVLLEVEDTGCGMDEQTRARIFEPFFSTKISKKGRGFGLATTFGIVSQTGGHIDVISELERGSTFFIYLPRVDEPSTPILFTEIGAEPSIELETILLVDDQPDLSSYAAMALEQYDYRVLQADSPAAALTLCENESSPIDLLITDVTMPGMGGRELFERVRRLHPNIDVIYMSGHSHDVVCSERGIEEEAPFLVKPFTPETIANLVRKVLDTQ
jgi:two-component system, cell cycle sensor histidine kinase and response regulator CckA